MNNFYFIYDIKTKYFLGGSRVKISGDNIECREVTKQEYEEYQAQQDEKKQQIESLISQIKNKKELLQKYKEDVEQVDLFGMERDNYEEKKELCKNLVLELRELEKELRGEE